MVLSWLPVYVGTFNYHRSTKEPIMFQIKLPLFFLPFNVLTNKSMKLFVFIIRMAGRGSELADATRPGEKCLCSGGNFNCRCFAQGNEGPVCEAARKKYFEDSLLI